MGDGPYATSTAVGTAWPWGAPDDGREWTEDELNDWIDHQIRTDLDFAAAWYAAKA